MNEDLRLSPSGEAFIKGWEGCGRRLGPDAFGAYLCPARVLTIGRGHTNAQGRQFTADDVWTQAECDQEFDADMQHFSWHVVSLVHVPLQQHQFDALVSFAENVGFEALANSTLLRKLNREDYNGAAREFLKWTHGGRPPVEIPGLVRRRIAEAALFKQVGGARIAGAADCTMPQHVTVSPAQPKRGGSGLVATGVGGLTLSELSSQASEHLYTLNNLKWQLQSLGLDHWLTSMLHDPGMLMGAAALAGVGYLYLERHKQHKEENS